MPKPLVQATGRRKRSIARVRLHPGTGVVTVNKKPVSDFFPSESQVMHATEPLRTVTVEESYDIDATIHGGGFSGQSGALRLGIARGLIELHPDERATLKAEGMLTRDPRKKESKKYGLKKARKAPQYSKR